MTDIAGRGTAVVIEDDADIRFLLETTLTQAGFRVYTASTGEAGVAAVREQRPVVTTLDISLPDFDGFEVARQIRAFSSTYLLMLTGRADEIDTLLGLEAGADDYVTKPFRPREIRARIDAMLRRPRASQSAVSSEQPVAAAPEERAPEAAPAPAAPAPAPRPTTSPSPTIAESAAVAADDEGVRRVGGLRVDLYGHLVEVDGSSLELTRSEFEILSAIVDAPRRVLTKGELAARVWPESYDTGAPVLDADRRALEVHVANLRRKLGEDATRPRFIQTVRGVGYRLVPGPVH